jgi:hypothetical protein
MSLERWRCGGVMISVPSGKVGSIFIFWIFGISGVVNSSFCALLKLAFTNAYPSKL